MQQPASPEASLAAPQADPKAAAAAEAAQPLHPDSGAADCTQPAGESQGRPAFQIGASPAAATDAFSSGEGAGSGSAHQQSSVPVPANQGNAGDHADEHVCRICQQPPESDILVSKLWQCTSTRAMAPRLGCSCQALVVKHAVGRRMQRCPKACPAGFTRATTANEHMQSGCITRRVHSCFSAISITHPWLSTASPEARTTTEAIMRGDNCSDKPPDVVMQASKAFCNLSIHI